MINFWKNAPQNLNGKANSEHFLPVLSEIKFWWHTHTYAHTHLSAHACTHVYDRSTQEYETHKICHFAQITTTTPFHVLLASVAIC